MVLVVWPLSWLGKLLLAFISLGLKNRQRERVSKQIIHLQLSQPFDLVKVRLQTSEGVYKNTADCFKQIIKKDGIFGLYRGMATPLASITPIFAVSFWVK